MIILENLIYFISVHYDVNIQPRTTDIDIGDDLTLTCTTAGFTKWFFKRKQLPPNTVISGVYGHILTVQNLTLSNNGFYQCYGKLRGKVGYFIANAYVMVHSE